MSNKKLSIGCVIPCYKGSKITINVINSVIKFTDLIVLVDDNCPYNTGENVERLFVKSNKVKVLYNKKNLGVGGATIKGMRYLLRNNFEIIVKVDADGQINPELIPELIDPLIRRESEAAKGNRFSSLDHILEMPLLRVVGNLGLSFLNKFSTGYWELFDPTNGFIAFTNSSLKKVRLDKVDNRYFFESDILFQCSLQNICFTQLPMKSIYSNEGSSLKPLFEIFRFSKKHTTNFVKRIIYQYFLLDFNIGSFEILSGSILFLILILLIIKIYLNGILNNQFATPGEANLIALLSIITFQLIVGFLYYDSTQQPLMRRIKTRKIY